MLNHVGLHENPFKVLPPNVINYNISQAPLILVAYGVLEKIKTP